MDRYKNRATNLTYWDIYDRNSLIQDGLNVEK